MELIVLNVNGRNYEVRVKKDWSLARVIREELQLKGTKLGCEKGACGSCKVLMNGVAVNSCSILAVNAVNKEIETIENLSQGSELHPIQEAFVEANAIQCGYCTPGMVMSTKALLSKNQNPDEEQIKDALKNNLCRCTGYVNIVEAVKLASKKMRGEE